MSRTQRSFDSQLPVNGLRRSRLCLWQICVTTSVVLHHPLLSFTELYQIISSDLDPIPDTHSIGSWQWWIWMSGVDPTLRPHSQRRLWIRILSPPLSTSSIISFPSDKRWACGKLSISVDVKMINWINLISWKMEGEGCKLSVNFLLPFDTNYPKLIISRSEFPLAAKYAAEIQMELGGGKFEIIDKFLDRWQWCGWRWWRLPWPRCRQPQRASPRGSPGAVPPCSCWPARTTCSCWR